MVAWGVQPGQRIAPHVHPRWQDSWMVMSGRGEYRADARGRTACVAAGDVVVAVTGEAPGVQCTLTDPLVIMSVVCRAEAGYAPL